MRTKTPVREDGSVRVSYIYDNAWSSNSPQSHGQFLCATLLEYNSLMSSFVSYLKEGKPKFFAGENGTLVFSKRIIEVSRA